MPRGNCVAFIYDWSVDAPLLDSATSLRIADSIERMDQESRVKLAVTIVLVAIHLPNG